MVIDPQHSIGYLGGTLDGVRVRGQNGIILATGSSATPRLTIGSNWVSNLDAYEEGDWTNVYNTDSGINNFVDTYSRYTVIGNQVTLYYTFTIGFSTANVRSYVVLNLPFSQRTNTSSIGGSVSCEQNSSPNRASVGTIMDASGGDATRCYLAFWPPVNGNHTVEGIIVYEKS